MGAKMGAQKATSGKHSSTFNTVERTTISPPLRIDVADIIKLNSGAHV